MRRKKKEKLKEENFWKSFFYFNIPAHINEVPQHMRRVNFRISGACDDDLLYMIEYVRSIEMLDLDEAEITNTGIAHLTQLGSLKELRLKGCKQIDDGCITSLCNIPSLELLHLGSTPVTADGWSKLKSLSTLKTLLISADDTAQIEAELALFAAALPQCEIIVNHKTYEK